MVYGNKILKSDRRTLSAGEKLFKYWRWHGKRNEILKTFKHLKTFKLEN